MTASGKISKSRVYVEVTVPSETGDPIQFFAEGQVTGELNVAELKRLLEMSEKEITKVLHLRTY